MIQSSILYFSVFFITSIFTEISVKIKNNSKNSMIFLMLFKTITLSIPAFFAGIRYNVGTDYFSYLWIFENIKKSGLFSSYRTEPGFNLINYIVGIIGGGAPLMFFIINLLTIYFVYKFLYDYRESLSVGLGMFVFLLLYYNTSLNVIRHILAIVIGANALKNVPNKNFKKFMIYTLLSFTVQRSSLVLIPIYFVYNYFAVDNRRNQLITYSIILILIMNLQKIIEFVSLNILKNKYYLNYAQQGQINFKIGLFIAFLPHILFGFFQYKKLNKKNSLFEYYYFILIIGFLLKLIAYFGYRHVNRIGDFFEIVLVWLVPYYVEYSKGKKSKIYTVSLILFLIAMWFIGTIIMQGGETVPYNIIW